MFPFCAAVDSYSGPHAESWTSYNDKATTVPILTKAVVASIPGLAQMDATDPAHFALNAGPEVLAKFPRTYVITAEHDPCRDDGRVLVRRLREECDKGVKEDYYEGLGHYFHWFPQLSLAHECMRDCVEGVKWVLDHSQK
jgi:versiconal hemiacetal acetate esterase